MLDSTVETNNIVTQNGSTFILIRSWVRRISFFLLKSRSISGLPCISNGSACNCQTVGPSNLPTYWMAIWLVDSGFYLMIWLVDSVFYLMIWLVDSVFYLMIWLVDSVFYFMISFYVFITTMWLRKPEDLNSHRPSPLYYKGTD